MGGENQLSFPVVFEEKDQFLEIYAVEIGVDLLSVINFFVVWIWKVSSSWFLKSKAFAFPIGISKIVSSKNIFLICLLFYEWKK